MDDTSHFNEYVRNQNTEASMKPTEREALYYVLASLEKLHLLYDKEIAMIRAALEVVSQDDKAS